MKKHGIYYGCRPLPGGKFGIVVAVYECGKWIETDLNSMPWPSQAIAIDRAKRNAEGLEQNVFPGFPVIAAADTRLAHAADMLI